LAPRSYIHLRSLAHLEGFNESKFQLPSFDEAVYFSPSTPLFIFLRRSFANSDFICAMATLFSSVNRSDCGNSFPISNALILSILLKTTNCSIVALSRMFPLASGFCSRHLWPSFQRELHSTNRLHWHRQMRLAV